MTLIDYIFFLAFPTSKVYANCLEVKHFVTVSTNTIETCDFFLMVVPHNCSCNTLRKVNQNSSNNKLMEEQLKKWL